MTCREFADFVFAWLEDGLTAEERRLFDAHLAVCPDCVRYMQQYRDTVTAARLMGEDGDEDVPAEVPADLVRAILDARKAR